MEKELLEAIAIINKVESDIKGGYIGKGNKYADMSNCNRIEAARIIIANVIQDYRKTVERNVRNMVREMLMTEDYSILNRKAKQERLTRHATLTHDIDTIDAARIVSEVIEQDDFFNN